jgi:hypothetical protein
MIIAADVSLPRHAKVRLFDDEGGTLGDTDVN